MRLIDADVLGIGLCNPDIFMDRAYAAGWNGVVRLLQSAPTITPESLVRHGRWVKKHRHTGGFRRYTGTDDMGAQHTITVDERLGYDDLYCSECGKQSADNFLDYCPNCGAKMDLEERHAESNH